jgi:serine/threonine protein kinase
MNIKYICENTFADLIEYSFKEQIEQDKIDGFLGKIHIQEEVQEEDDFLSRINVSGLNTPSPRSGSSIGSGTYGEVSMIDPFTVKKKMKLYNGSRLNTRNLREVIILSSYKAPFIPDVKNIEYDDNHIYLYESYQGKSLKKLALELSYEERICLVPSLLVQFGRILTWLKIHNLAHMDIKPDNVALSDDGVLSLLDFGLASPVCVNTDGYIGTAVYSDPYCLTHKKVSYEYDMFGAAMTIFGFLNKGHVNQQDHADIPSMGHNSSYQLGRLIRFNHHKYTFESVLGNTHMSEILEKMLYFGPREHKRITPHELYNHPYLAHLRKDFRLTKALVDTQNKLTGKVPDASDKNPEVDFGKHQSLLMLFLEDIEAPFLLSYVWKIFNVIVEELEVSDPKLEILTAIHIAACVFDIDISFKKDFGGVVFTKEEITQNVFDILASFDYQLLPKCNIADWELTRVKNITKDPSVIAEWMFQPMSVFLSSESEKKQIVKKINHTTF